MKINAYSVFDSTILAYSRPFYAVRDEAMSREFQNLINNPECPNQNWRENSEDFQLFRIGEYDDSTAVFKSFPPVSVCTLASLKKSEKTGELKNEE